MSDSRKGSREEIEPAEDDTRYTHRDDGGQFSHQVDEGASSAADQQHDAENESTPGHGDQGDRKPEK